MGIEVVATVTCEGCGRSETTPAELVGGGTHQVVYPKRWSQLLNQTFNDQTGEIETSEYVPICPDCVRRVLNA